MEGVAMGEEVPRCIAEFPYTDSKEMWTTDAPLEAMQLARKLSAAPGEDRPFAVYAAIQGKAFIAPIGHPFIWGQIAGNGFKYKVQWYDPTDGGWYDVDAGLTKDEARDLVDHLHDHHDFDEFRLIHANALQRNTP